MRLSDNDWKPFTNLLGFVRLILLVDWDPIGVLGIERAMDEYDSYASDICDLLQAGTSRAALIAHLNNIEMVTMNSRGNVMGQKQVADKLLRMYQTIPKYEKSLINYADGDDHGH